MDIRALRHVFGMDRASTKFDSFSKHHYDNAWHPLPAPTGTYPFHLDFEDVLGREAADRVAAAGKLVFHTVGDTGNLPYGAEAQDSVAFHMEEQMKANEPDRPAFFYHLGDVVYYNGERGKYEAQFYEPYFHYTAPIVAIAGNHDGAVLPNGDPSLQGFVENFCASQPKHTWMAGNSNRTTMIQPNVYWTFKTPLATFIGLYSNVTGQLDKGTRVQEEWLAAELTAAKKDKCVIVAVHHPPYSLDDTHGGHVAIQESLDRAFDASGRTPSVVLTAHVHNYQHFERKLGEARVPYLVIGAGGYAGYSRLHQLKSHKSPAPGVTLKGDNTKLPGFMRVTITKTEFLGEYFVVPPPPGHLSGVATLVDTVSVKL